MKNQTMPELDELYKEVILEHYRHPHGRIPLQRIDFKANGVNPLCGDEVILAVQVDTQNKIERVHIEGHGCSISVASGSILASLLEGKTLNEAKEISDYFKDIMRDKVKNNDLDIGDLEVLFGVKRFPVRIKCALLPWTTLEEALVGHEHVEIS